MADITFIQPNETEKGDTGQDTECSGSGNGNGDGEGDGAGAEPGPSGSGNSDEDGDGGGYGGIPGIDMPDGGDYQEDEHLSPLARLEKYAISDDIYNRQMVGRVMVQVIRETPPNALAPDIPALMNVIYTVAHDTESVVRSEILDQIPHMAMVCADSRVPSVASVASEQLLPLVALCLADSDPQVRKTAQVALLILMKHNLVSNYDVEKRVCPMVLQLTHADSKDDIVPNAINLMSKMVSLLGQEATERLFLQRFSELCRSSTLSIRKMCASSIAEFCAVGPEAFEYILLPRFLELCSDDIWYVRKACAETVMSVSCVCSQEQRRTQLADAFLPLLVDESRWVRTSAFQVLGPFISTFAEPKITQLAYDNNRMLVLVDSDGYEFKINSPALTHDIREPTSYQKLYEFKKRQCEKIDDLKSRSKDNLVDDDDDENDDQIYFDMYNRKSNNSGVNYHNSSSGSGSDITSTYASEEQELNNLDKSNEPSPEKEETHGTNTKSEIDMECTEKISAATSVNEMSLSSIIKSLDLMFVDEKTADCDSDNIVSDGVKEGDECLDKYNTYQYWYISPDMPLDDDLVCRGVAVDGVGVDGVKKQQSNGCDVQNQLNEPVLDYNSINKNITNAFNVYDQFDIQNVNEPKRKSVSMKREIPIQHIVPQCLLDHYVSMTSSVLSDSIEADLCYHCAFSFPAVALTLGRDNWEMLRDTYCNLAGNFQWKVRRTVAVSLHKIAAILGEQLATEHLTPIFDDFIKDLDEVRIGILKYMAKFFRLINTQKRDQYLPRLNEFLVNDAELNWRFRAVLAEQLEESVALWSPKDVSYYISPIALQLLDDKIAAVRNNAIMLVVGIIQHIQPDTSDTSRFLADLAQQFAHSKKWTRRQAFVTTCARLVSHRALSPERISRELMPHLLDLCWDPVANVRLGLARAIINDVMNHEYFNDPSHNKNHEQLFMVIRRLQADKDRDVRQAALFRHGLFPVVS